VIKLRELIVILDLHKQGLTISAIAERTGLDRKTVRKYIERGLEPPVYGPRQPRVRVIDAYAQYVRERLSAYPELSNARLLREIRALGYPGGKTMLGDFVRQIRPASAPLFEVRFETPPGEQAQVDFAHFKVVFDDEPGVTRVVWLFSMVLGHSRYLFARFCLHQDLQTLLRLHIEAFEHFGGVPREILYDRMKTAVIGESAEGVVTYNPSLVGLLNHYGAVPRACRPYRAQTKGKVERPYRYVREDFFLARSFRDLDDLNAQFEAWRTTVANVRVHATTRRVVAEHFAEEQPALITHPAVPYSAVLTIERRVSREGMVSVGGNLYSVPDTTRKRVLDVQSHPKEIRIFEDGALIAVHPVLDGKNRRRVDPAHRKVLPAVPPATTPSGIGVRPLSFYDAVARRLAGERMAS